MIEEALSMSSLPLSAANLLILGALLTTPAGPAKGQGNPAPTPPAAEAGIVNLEVVKYEKLAEAVRAQRGKVVVVDVWGTFCLPCMQAFPHLVQLNLRHAHQGLVCISVTVDPVSKRDAALEFLRKQQAFFPHYLLDEDSALWTKRWGADSVPLVFVFDRDGTRVAKFGGSDSAPPFDHEDVERLVERLLAPTR
jgi:thiol-disulfide isomerase/thioredoxin